MAWTALVMLSHTDDGLYHLDATTESDSPDEAVKGVKLIFDIFTTNRETFVRVKPEVATETSFNSKKSRSRGFTKCSFRLDDGPHHQLLLKEMERVP